jgi:hypothetical protein
VDVKLQTCTRALLSPQHTSLVSSNFSLFFFISVSAVGPLMSPQGDNVLAPYIGNLLNVCCHVQLTLDTILNLVRVFT